MENEKEPFPSGERYGLVEDIQPFELDPSLPVSGGHWLLEYYERRSPRRKFRAKLISGLEVLHRIIVIALMAIGLVTVILYLTEKIGMK